MGTEKIPAGPKISAADVRHVATLARLDVTDEEVELFAGQLAAVLEDAQDVEALDTAGVPAAPHPLPPGTVLGEDVPRDSLDRDEVLSQAPAAEDRRFRVPRILGEAP